MEPRYETSNITFSVRTPDYASAKWSLGISIVDVLDVTHVRSMSYIHTS